MKIKYLCAFQRVIALLLNVFLSMPFFYGQERIHSVMDSYFDFLSLDGVVEQPYINYRTLSDSKWATVDSTVNIWGIKSDISNRARKSTVRIYGPELYSSFNSGNPYGQNDGILWQGKGANIYFTAGIRCERNGFEITFKPEFTFSQNRSFPFMSPVYSGDVYMNKADTYGYYGIPSVDVPQRFGDKAFFDLGWGDSEIRYSYKKFTVGFGTQYLWLGPAKINPILHSNNAPSYPRFDIGIRKTPIRLWDWYAGDFEARMWGGRLKESDYFDNDETNNLNLISGISIGIAPSFLKGLSVSVNRTFLCPWNWDSANSFIKLITIPTGEVSGADDLWDQRVSISFDYRIPTAGFQTYMEIGQNDYCPLPDGYVRYPFHTMVYTAGLRKSVTFPNARIPMKGEVLIEISNLEMSQDHQFQWPSTFYAHHLILQGYTNRGQWLGAGNGTGGNCQFISFKLYYPKGNASAYFRRSNPDNDYIYQYSIGTANSEGGTDYIEDIKAILSTGINTVYFLRPNVQLSAGISYIQEHNPLYNTINWGVTSKMHALRLEAGFIYLFR